MRESSRARSDSGPRWSTPADLLKRLGQRWQRGEFLADALTGHALFPLRVPLKTPTAVEIRDGFEGVQKWVAGWKSKEGQGLACEWKTIRHRLFGENRLPAALLFPDIGALAKALNVHGDWSAFRQLVERTRPGYPELLPWLARRPLHALALSDDWGKLLSIIDWVRHNRRSNRFLRQVDLPGVHTKFIEAHRGTLIELLDLTLPPDAIDPDARGVAQFSQRYGFQEKPGRVRLRFLDPAIAIEPERLGLDLTLNVAPFSRLCPRANRVFITENEINFLAFPELPESLLIFGSGYQCSALKDADWLHRCEIHYWGDIDTHGFAILSQLRSFFPHARSLLMDGATLDALGPLVTSEPQPARGELPNLTPEELALYRHLQSSPVRLEQEKIPYSMLQNALRQIIP